MPTAAERMPSAMVATMRKRTPAVNRQSRGSKYIPPRARPLLAGDEPISAAFYSMNSAKSGPERRMPVLWSGQDDKIKT
jgi:small neutral amino acid transporter SnatA (MarC family)